MLNLSDNLKSPHLDVSACRDLDPTPTVSNHIIFHYLPVPAEPHTVATVFIDAVATKLHPAVFLHDNTASTVFDNAVGKKSGQLSALQHSNARATVAVDEVPKHVQGLAALHVQADRYEERGRERRLKAELDASDVKVGVSTSVVA